MLIIFGTKDLLIHRGRTSGKSVCPNCGCELNNILNTRMSWFSLFWIPIFPYRFERRVECPLCGYLHDVTGREYDELLKTRYKDRIRRL